MSRAHDFERAIMAADAIGCAVAGVVAIVTPAGAIVATMRPRRIALAAALTLSSIALGQGFRRRELTAGDLALGAVLNSAWVAACVAAAPRHRSALGRRLVIATGLLDATAGAVQGLLAVRRRATV